MTGRTMAPGARVLPYGPPVAGDRKAQLAYSETHPGMLNLERRRQKAEKIIAVTTHYLGRDDLSGLVVADVGCSNGIIADALSATGARVIGLDIDAPGIRRAADRFQVQGGPSFVCADSQQSPLADGSVDVVVCNHVYEHVVSPEALFSEIKRILSPEGIAYLGLVNKWGPIEPHYKLPFLSWIPRSWAHPYVRMSGRADHYHESFRTRRQLRRLVDGLDVWDYTYSVLAEPERFAMGRVGHLPPSLAAATARVARPVVPTFLWVASRTPREPAGPALVRPPRRV